MKRVMAVLLLLAGCSSGEQDYLEAFPIEEYEVAEVPGIGRFYIDDNPALVKTTLKSGQPWEPEILAVLEKHIVPGSTVIDAGAHIGSLSIPMARMVGPEGKVFSFEPQRKIHRELYHNVRLNRLDNVSALRFALGDEPGYIEMDPLDVYDGRVAVGKGGDQVELRTIDSFNFSNVSLIKIDVEGFEAPVLRGARETIEKWRPAIVLELNKVEAGQFLLEHDYLILTIQQIDCLALPRESIAPEDLETGR